MRVVKSSGLITAAQSPYVVVGYPCILVAAHGYTDGSNDAVITIYDHSSTPSGVVLAKYQIKGAELQVGEGGIWALATNGLVVTISGGNSAALLRWVPVSGGDTYV